MAGLKTAHFAEAKGIIYKGRDGNALLAEGSTVPSDAVAGYAPGCIFFKRAGGTFGGHYVNDGTAASCDFNLVTLNGVNLAALTATAVELNYLDSDGGSSQLTTGAGVGITSGTGTIYKTSIIKIGNIIHTCIYIDLTGLASIATDGDVIGVNGGGVAHIGKITAAQNGTIESMRVTCEEAPAGGLADIDFFRATVGTAVQDDAISGVTGQATTGVTNAGNWTNGLIKCATAVPAANDFLYLCSGAASGNGTYTAGKFRIELLGY